MHLQMKLRLQTHIQCIYFCKWIAVGLSITFVTSFSLESNIELKIIIKQSNVKNSFSKFKNSRFYTHVS